MSVTAVEVYAKQPCGQGCGESAADSEKKVSRGMYKEMCWLLVALKALCDIQSCSHRKWVGKLSKIRG